MDGHTDRSGQEHAEHGRPNPIWFVPGKLCLMIEHERGLGAEQLAEVVKTTLLRFNDMGFGDRFPGWQFEPAQEPHSGIHIFPADPDDANPDDADSDHGEPEVDIVNRQGMIVVGDIPYPSEDGSLARSMVHVTIANENGPAELIAFITELEDERSPQSQAWSHAWEAARQRGAKQIDVLPDWLMSPTPHNGTEGGPGTRPVSADRANPHFEFPALTQDIGTGRGHTIFILDSLPHGMKDGERRFSAVRSVVAAPQTALPPEEEDSADGAREKAIKLIKHQYDLADHGLFIAYLVQAIAPKVKLRMYEVLNKHGVGSYAALTTQLTRVYARLKRTASQSAGNVRNSLNCSFVLNMPTHGHNLFNPDELKQVVDKSLYLIQALFDVLNRTDTVILAAAGNEGRGTIHPAARYLAAFRGVYGVGALDSSHQIASYSSEADTTDWMEPVEGFWIFGGDADPSFVPTGDEARLANHKTGLLGPYHGPVFKKGINASGARVAMETTAVQHTGWVRWAGTSFATAIMSGLVAAVASDHPDMSRNDLMDFIRGHALQPPTPVLGGDRIACNVTYTSVP